MQKEYFVAWIDKDTKYGWIHQRGNKTFEEAFEIARGIIYDEMYHSEMFADEVEECVKAGETPYCKYFIIQKYVETDEIYDDAAGRMFVELAKNRHDIPVNYDTE